MVAMLIIAATLSYMVATGKTIDLMRVTESMNRSGASNKPAQEDNPKATTQPKESLEELIKYKDLLDSGIITEEEFTEKKQIIGIPNLTDSDMDADENIQKNVDEKQDIATTVTEELKADKEGVISDGQI